MQSKISLFVTILFRNEVYIFLSHKIGLDMQVIDLLRPLIDNGFRTEYFYELMKVMCFQNYSVIVDNQSKAMACKIMKGIMKMTLLKVQMIDLVQVHQKNAFYWLTRLKCLTFETLILTCIDSARV